MLRKWKVGIATVADVRARCSINPVSGCWNWLGGTRKGADHATYRQPAMWAFCHDHGEKRTMTGPRAMWNIAHGKAPLPGYVVFRACGNAMCLNPVHLREAKNMAEVGLHTRRSGRLVGTQIEARRANVLKAQDAAGVVRTPDEVVEAIKAAGRSVTGRALAAQYGVSENTVSRIRLGRRHSEAAA